MSAVTERHLRNAERGWIGVDFDGTLARYDGWAGVLEFGEPIPAMVERIREWVAAGIEVRIMTARMILPTDEYHLCSVTGAYYGPDEIDAAIGDWTEKHVGHRLRATCVKDLHMIELWDDRAVQVVPNTGRTLVEEYESELSALRGKP
jgi:hypothetical protein